MLLLAACVADEADRFLVMEPVGDTYVSEGHPIPELDDPQHMSGTLGTVEYGGRFTGDDWTPTYEGGRGLDVVYEVQDGVAIPADLDGLLLFSFYAHFADARAVVEAHGVDMSAIFPVDLAWNPAVDWSIELSAADNAAYATGSNVFILLPDGDDREVPMLANKGVIAHEFGHAVFHLLCAGGPHEPPVVQEIDGTAAHWQASLHEGFADSLASLSLDDPHYLDASVDMPSRHVDDDAVMSSTVDPSATTSTDILSLYDPYPLGTVFASAIWDVRVTLDDPEATLDLLLRAATNWHPDADFSGWSWLDAWVDAAADEDELTAVCAAIDNRFYGWAEPAGCP